MTISLEAYQAIQRDVDFERGAARVLAAENEQLRSLLRWVASGEPCTPEIRRQITEALGEGQSEGTEP